MPTIHTSFRIPASEGSSPHHPSFTSAAGTEAAHEIALLIGKSLAFVGYDVLADDDFHAAVKAEWSEKIAASTDPSS